MKVRVASDHLELMPVGLLILAGPVHLDPPALAVLAAVPSTVPARPLVRQNGSFAVSLQLGADVTPSPLGEPPASWRITRAGLSQKSKTYPRKLGGHSLLRGTPVMSNAKKTCTFIFPSLQRKRSTAGHAITRGGGATDPATRGAADPAICGAADPATRGAASPTARGAADVRIFLHAGRSATEASTARATPASWKSLAPQ